jgi:hypothetical protein
VLADNLVFQNPLTAPSVGTKAVINKKIRHQNMPKQNTTFAILSLIIILITSCLTSHHKQHIYLTDYKYDSSSNSTTFSYLGDFSINVDIPGKWKYVGFDKNSRDHIFSDSLKQNLFIFIGTRGTSSFNQGNLDGDDFIDLFYKWDSEYYLSNNSNLKTRTIDRVANKYLVAEYADSTNEITSLYGTKNEKGVRILIASEANTKIQTDLVSTIYNNLK